MLKRLALVLLASAALAVPAQATNVLSILPAPTQFIGIGGDAVLVLEMNFDDETLGGGVSLQFDGAIVELISVSFRDELGDDPDFRCPGAVVCDGPISEISFGTFGGLQGQQAVADLQFRGLALGTTAVSFTIPEDNPFSSDIGSELPVGAGGSAQIEVIPEPTTAVLVGLGLAALAFARRRP